MPRDLEPFQSTSKLRLLGYMVAVLHPSNKTQIAVSSLGTNGTPIRVCDTAGVTGQLFMASRSGQALVLSIRATEEDLRRPTAPEIP